MMQSCGYPSTNCFGVEFRFQSGRYTDPIFIFSCCTPPGMMSILWYRFLPPLLRPPSSSLTRSFAYFSSSPTFYSSSVPFSPFLSSSSHPSTHGFGCLLFCLQSSILLFCNNFQELGPRLFRLLFLEILMISHRCCGKSSTQTELPAASHLLAPGSTGAKGQIPLSFC